MFPPTVHLISNTIVNPRSHPLRVRAQAGTYVASVPGRRGYAHYRIPVRRTPRQKMVVGAGWRSARRRSVPTVVCPVARAATNYRAGIEVRSAHRGPIERGNAKEW